MTKHAIIIAAVLFSAAAAFAQPYPGTGPVATQCQDDIGKYCAGKEHGTGDIRACLQANYTSLSADCKQAMDTTGGGWRRNQAR